MKIRLKKRGVFGVKMISLDGKIGKIEKSESLNIFVRGIEGLGLVSFSGKEIEMLASRLKNKEVKEKKAKKKVVKRKGKKRK